MEFVRYANSALTNQGHGGLVSSLSENMFKAVLVEKINNFLESEDYVSRVGTTASIPRRIIASVRLFSFVLTILNLIILIVFICRYVKRAPTLVTPPNSLELRPLTSTQGTLT